MEAVVYEAFRRQPLEVWCITWPAKGAGSAKAYVIEHDDEHLVYFVALKEPSFPFVFLDLIVEFRQ